MLFKRWQEASHRHNGDVRRLDAMRDGYALANAADRAAMSAGILALEAEVEKDADALRKMEYEIRRLEQEAIYR